MQNKICVLIFLLTSGAATAQENFFHDVRTGVSYFSQGGAYPGFTLNAEKKLLTSPTYQFLIGAKVGAYFHYRNNSGVFLMLQSGQRYRIHRRLFFEHYLGAGFLQTFLNGGDAYYVNASGQVQKKHSLGSPHFMPSVSLGVCYDVNDRHNVSIFLRPMVYWQIPFNQVSLVQYAFEIGTIFKIRP